MLRKRVIPCLLLNDESLVKTVQFGNFNYIGDPANTVRIFNELEVDELCFLDIRASVEKREPNFRVLREIADECFMPLSYGGGIRDAETARKILNTGFEKVILNSVAFDHPSVVTDIADYSGSQSVIGSLDVKKNLWGTYHVYSHGGTKKQKSNPLEWAKYLESLGVGEILVTSMDREGTWDGFDVEITREIAKAVKVPVIANGGAGTIHHIAAVMRDGGASAVALGSMVVYQKKGMGVLVNFPDKKELEKVTR